MLRLLLASWMFAMTLALQSVHVRPGHGAVRPGFARGNGRRGATTSGEDEVSRRGLIGKGLGALAVGGIVANKVAVEGPPVFTPAPGTLTDEIIVITGGNNGLGKESAIRLAKGGATIVITVRSAAKGEAAVKEIKEASSNDKVFYFICDLADLNSVKAASAAFKSLPVPQRIDVLLNNAGVMAIPEYQTTKDGFEKQFGVNYLGHFALTAELFSLLRAAPKSRIINVASSANLGATGKDFDTPLLGMEKENYTQWGSYCKSKLSNVLFTKELDRRVRAAGLPMSVVSLHPGAVRTELARYLAAGEDKPMIEAVGDNLASKAALFVGLYFTKAVDRGANTQVWLAAGADGDDPMKVSGAFLQNLKPGILNPVANDEALAKRVWDVSEKLTGTKLM